MSVKRMTYTGDEEREVPGIGVFKPGDEVDFSETLQATGLFTVNDRKQKQKEAED